MAQQKVSESDILKALDELEGMLSKSQIGSLGGHSGDGNLDGQKVPGQGTSDHINEHGDYKGSSKTSKGEPAPPWMQGEQASPPKGKDDDQEDPEEEDDDQEDPEGQGDSEDKDHDDEQEGSASDEAEDVKEEEEKKAAAAMNLSLRPIKRAMKKSQSQKLKKGDVNMPEERFDTSQPEPVAEKQQSGPVNMPEESFNVPNPRQGIIPSSGDPAVAAALAAGKPSQSAAELIPRQVTGGGDTNKSVNKGVEVTDFMYFLKKSVCDSISDMELRLTSMAKSMQNKRGTFAKALANGVVGISTELKKSAGEVSNEERQPKNAPKSVTKAADTQGNDLQKSQRSLADKMALKKAVMDEMTQKVMKGELPVSDLTNFELSGVLRPGLEKSLSCLK